MRPSSTASILIVEDERLVAKDIQQMLMGFGYDAFAIANSSDDALAKVTARRPDLVMMDIRIKGERDGVETAALLRERFGVAVVYLTAHADDATIERAKQTQPHGYLIKPITAAELHSAVEISLYKHEMETQLRERERWFSTTLHAIADAVVSVDLSGRITFMNAAAEQLVGDTAQASLGRAVGDVVPLLDVQAGELPETPLDRVLREGRPVELPEAILRRGSGGELVFISGSASPVVDEDRTIGAVMVFRDVSERKRLHKRLEQLAALGTMAAGVVHELGNPLTAITGNAEYVESELERLHHETRKPAGARLDAELPARLLEPVQELLTAAKRMAKIVSDIQSFSRPLPPSMITADVARAIRSATSSTAHELQQRARLVADIGELPPVKADEARLEQIFVNLLINASQGIDAGQPEANEVGITARTDQLGRAVIEVRDSGRGIPPEILGRIFEPFFTTKPIGVGTGLGLSICSAIIESIGGEVAVESELGKGTMFRVVLPGTTAAPPPRPAPEPLDALPGVRGRVLAIDDEKMILSTIVRLLSPEHEVECVDSARRALAMLERGERFDLMLCDVMMPQMSGIQLYEELLRNHPDHARRVVFVTGGATDPAVNDFLRSVPNPCVDKPFTKVALLGLVRQQLAVLRAQGR